MVQSSAKKNYEVLPSEITFDGDKSVTISSPKFVAMLKQGLSEKGGGGYRFGRGEDNPYDPNPHVPGRPDQPLPMDPMEPPPTKPVAGIVIDFGR